VEICPIKYSNNNLLQWLSLESMSFWHYSGISYPQKHPWVSVFSMLEFTAHPDLSYYKITLLDCSNFVDSCFCLWFHIWIWECKNRVISGCLIKFSFSDPTKHTCWYGASQPRNCSNYGKHIIHPWLKN
jgi:hypothetical protein